MVPPQAAAWRAALPVEDPIPKPTMEITRKIMVIMKVRIPYGKAKHGFFNFPVAHPRHAIKRPTTTIAIFPFPIPEAPP